MCWEFPINCCRWFLVVVAEDETGRFEKKKKKTKKNGFGNVDDKQRQGTDQNVEYTHRRTKDVFLCRHKVIAAEPLLFLWIDGCIGRPDRCPDTQHHCNGQCVQFVFTINNLSFHIGFSAAFCASPFPTRPPLLAVQNIVWVRHFQHCTAQSAPTTRKRNESGYEYKCQCASSTATTPTTTKKRRNWKGIGQTNRSKKQT